MKLAYTCALLAVGVATPGTALHLYHFKSKQLQSGKMRFGKCDQKDRHCVMSLLQVLPKNECSSRGSVICSIYFITGLGQ